MERVLMDLGWGFAWVRKMKSCGKVLFWGGVVEGE